jgi:hypothetical protein
MDTTTAVLLIGVGGTVVLAVTALLTTRAIAARTIEAASSGLLRMLDAARDDRLWQRKADAYTTAIRLLQHRLAVRESANRIFGYDEDADRRTAELLGAFAGPEELEVSASLLTYASPVVFAALQACFEANENFGRLVRAWESLATQSRGAAQAVLEGRPVAAAGEILEAREAAQAALDQAKARDTELIEAIRSDLHARPSEEPALRLAAAQPGTPETSWLGLLPSEPPSIRN